MLSTPDVQELPDSFSHYFARATDLILTGKFYDVDITPSDVTGIEWQTVNVAGLKKTDSIVITPKIVEADLAIVGAYVPTDGVLSLGWMNAASIQTPSAQTIQVLAIRRERE